MHKKRVLIIGTTDNQGGAASVGWDLGHELIKRGYSVKYIVGYKKSNKDYVYELHKPIITKWLDQHTRYNATGLYRHLIAYFTGNNIDSGASDEILNHPWYKSADIVHCHNLHGNFFKLDTLIKISEEKKLVWTLHDMSPITGKCAYIEDQNAWKDGYHRCNNLSSYPPMLWDNTQYMWKRKSEIYSELQNGVIVIPSKWLYDIVTKSILKNLPKQLIYNGIDTSIFYPKLKSQLRKKLNLPPSKKIIIFTAQGGQYDPRKGWKFVEQIIDQYKDNKDVHFVCIGSGTSLLHSDNITIIPFIQDKKLLSEYYKASDVLLFTSLVENCPLVVLEAMSCGLPIVSLHVGGVPELVTHKINGYIAKYKDGEDLSVGLKWALNLTDSETEQLATINRKKVMDKYSSDKMVDQYEALFKRI